MRKLLLMAGAALLAAGPAYSEFKVAEYDNAPWTGISANGKYGAFSLEGMMLSIVDLENPEIGYTYYDQEGYNEYYVGYGTPVALDGKTVGNAMLVTLDENEGTTTTTDNAVVFDKGEMIILKAVNSKMTNMAHSITPDGSVICGNIGNDHFNLEATKIMMVPAVWYREADGSYGDPVLLPHPEKDFLGGVPQYITAVAMSEDGNTVAGTITSSSGFWVYPIVYKRDAAGEWSYTLPNLDLFYTHPEVKLPADPGDYPQMKDFMSDEEIAAYNAAMQAWMDAGGNDYSNYPNLSNFISEEEKAAYDAACATYMTDKAAYEEAVDKATEGSITLVYNNVVLSPDGKTYAAGEEFDNGMLMAPAVKGRKRMVRDAKYSPLAALKARRAAEGEDDPEEPEPTANVCVFNLVDGTYTKSTTANGAYVTCAANGNKFVGFSGDAYLPEAVVIEPGKSVRTFQDYYKETCPEISTWITENAIHEVESYDFILGEIVTEEMVLSGQPVCTPDMQTIATYAMVTWEGKDAYYVSSVFTGLPEETSAVKGLQDAGADAPVEFYTVDGLRVNKPAAGQLVIRKQGGKATKIVVK